MSAGIVICTWPGGKESLKLLLGSLQGVPYPIVIVLNGGHNLEGNDWTFFERLSWDYTLIPQEDLFEIGAIQKILEVTDWDEFVFLQDTIFVKNQEIFNILFEQYEGRSVAYNPHFQMYLGKFRRSILDQMVLPVVSNKVESVRQEEIFTKEYRRLDPDTVVFNPNFVDGNFHHLPKEFIFGRENLVMSDDYIIKRKGTWDSSQL